VIKYFGEITLLSYSLSNHINTRLFLVPEEFVIAAVFLFAFFLGTFIFLFF
jgi:hypothetical protein